MGIGSALIGPDIATLAACNNKKDGQKLGIALVGLGGYATYQLAPALQETKNCYLAGIVTGTPAKEKIWADRYSIPAKNIYNYQTFDNIAGNPDIDIVYIVLPPGLHKEYTIRGAEAGKHVICEKPMAIGAADCQLMIDACKKKNRMLSIGYRLHFEPYNMEMMRLGQKKIFGAIKKIESANSFTFGNDNTSWRVKKSLAGGGPMMDMGVYVIQGARYTTGEEPVYVSARQEKTRPDFFTEVEETCIFEMEFPSGAKAFGRSSYNENSNSLHVEAEKGWFELSEAYRYGGMVGATSRGKMNFPNINQQAAQMDDFANCILTGKPTRVPGEMGMQDMRIVDAIYRSLESGKKEKV